LPLLSNKCLTYDVRRAMVSGDSGAIAVEEGEEGYVARDEVYSRVAEHLAARAGGPCCLLRVVGAKIEDVRVRGRVVYVVRPARRESNGGRA
jgi:hypothetical protein